MPEKHLVDLLQKHATEVTINADGVREFHTPAGSVSMWTEKQ